MEIIDRIPLLEKCDDTIKELFKRKEELGEDDFCHMLAAVATMKIVIASAPTVDAPEGAVKRGAWLGSFEDGKMIIQCSECEYATEFDDDHMYVYCPYCGARMGDD